MWKHLLQGKRRDEIGKRGNAAAKEEYADCVSRSPILIRPPNDRKEHHW